MRRASGSSSAQYFIGSIEDGALEQLELSTGSPASW